MSGASLPSARIKSSVSRITVSVLSPRRSTFKSPNSSSVPIGNCVVTDSSFFWSGTNSLIGFSDITTPEACVEAWRGSPSSLQERSMSLFTFASVLYKSLSSLDSSIARASVMLSSFGISLAILSTSAYGIRITRPTSFTAALAAIVPNVIICDTFSAPYFSVT